MMNPNDMPLRKDVSLRRDGLRKEIVGERPRLGGHFRRRIENPSEQRERTTKIAMALGGATLLVLGAIFAVFSVATSSPDAVAVSTQDAPESVAANTVTTLDSRTLASDGGQVRRATVVGLGGRVSESTAEPVTLAARSAGELQAPRVPSFTVGEAVDDPRPAAGLVIAQANLVWARVFTAAGMSYAPLHHAPRDEWAAGACAMRDIEPGATYCEHNRTVYLDSVERVDPVGILDLAHVVGHHVQNMAGVAITPLSGEAREFQADCFAGMWAAREPSVQSAMEPGALRVTMMDGYPLSLYDRSRHEAFTQGFVAREIGDCADISTAWLKSAE